MVSPFLMRGEPSGAVMKMPVPPSKSRPTPSEKSRPTPVGLYSTRLPTRSSCLSTLRSASRSCGFARMTGCFMVDLLCCATLWGWRNAPSSQRALPQDPLDDPDLLQQAIDLPEEPDHHVGVIGPHQIIPGVRGLPSLDGSHVGLPAKVEGSAVLVVGLHDLLDAPVEPRPVSGEDALLSEDARCGERTEWQPSIRSFAHVVPAVVSLGQCCLQRSQPAISHRPSLRAPCRTAPPPRSGSRRTSQGRSAPPSRGASQPARANARESHVASLGSPSHCTPPAPGRTSTRQPSWP